MLSSRRRIMRWIKGIIQGAAKDDNLELLKQQINKLEKANEKLKETLSELGRAIDEVEKTRNELELLCKADE